MQFHALKQEDSGSKRRGWSGRKKLQITCLLNQIWYSVFMKKGLVSLLLISFVGLGVFGLFAMHHGSEASGFCLARSAEASPCVNINPFVFIDTHISAFKNFSQSATFGIGSFVLALAALSVLFVYLFAANKPPPDIFFGSRRVGYGMPLLVLERARFRRWLSLHENSPSLR